jgi:hypothetical protein
MATPVGLPLPLRLWLGSKAARRSSKPPKKGSGTASDSKRQQATAKGKGALSNIAPLVAFG